MRENTDQKNFEYGHFSLSVRSNNQPRFQILAAVREATDKTTILNKVTK